MIIVYCLFPLLVKCVSMVILNDRSFSYAEPFLWNRLDMSIRMLDFDHFKSRIKTELYLRYFEA